MRHLLLLSLISTTLVASEPPAFVNLPSSDAATATTLPQRGTGILRWKWLVTLYQTSLYLNPYAADAVSVSPKRLRMDYLRDFSRDDMVRATEKTIGRNITPATLNALQPALAAWNALYPAINKGDSLEFDHLPGGTLIMRHNGTPCGSVTDETFARALFSIWIGPQAVDTTLRDQLISVPLSQ